MKKIICWLYGHDHRNIDGVAKCECGHIDWNKSVKYMADEAFMNRMRKLKENDPEAFYQFWKNLCQSANKEN